MTTVPTSSAPTDRDAARGVRAEVDAADGRLRVAGSTLLALFDGDRLDEPTAARIGRALGEQQLTCRPALGAGVAPHDLVEIRSPGDPAADREPVIDDPAPPEPVAAPLPAQVLVGETAALPAAALTAGVLVPGALLTVAGFVSYWLYGLLFLALTAGTWLLIRHARFWVARIFYLPVRSAWMTGFLLAASPLLIAALIATTFVVAPLASKRAADERSDRAHATLSAARADLRDGDVDGARRGLVAARAQDSGVTGADALERAIDEEQRRREVEAARQADYDRARAALDADDERAALALFGDLDGYRDSDALAGAARRDLTGERLSAARAAFAAGDYASARAAAADSLGIDATPAARRLEARAGAALAHERAVARARARAKARARAEARADARRAAAERRRQRELERQLQQQREEEAAAAPAPSVPAGTCSEIGITDFAVPPGDPRDADGDGIACES